MSITLPQPLEEYFKAADTTDVDRIAECFAEDARVHDESRDHVGRAAIREWAREARERTRFQSTPFSVAGSDERPIVTAHVVGDFPGSPIDLRYNFGTSGGRITSLSITPA